MFSICSKTQATLDALSGGLMDLLHDGAQLGVHLWRASGGGQEGVRSDGNTSQAIEHYIHEAAKR
eukprot:925381-Pyramimonas_sp.AAC.2